MALFNNNTDTTPTTATPAGMTRKGASRAKPARAAAQSVRAASPKTSGRRTTEASLSKDEKRERRRQERDARDRQQVSTNILLKQMTGYKTYRRIWWVGLGVGLGFTAISWMAMFVLPGASSEFETPMGKLSVIALIVAYVCIIGSFIFDFVKIRPLRRKAEAISAGLTERKRQQLIDADYEQSERERAAKGKGKASKA